MVGQSISNPVNKKEKKNFYPAAIATACSGADTNVPLVSFKAELSCEKKKADCHTVTRSEEENKQAQWA